MEYEINYVKTLFNAQTLLFDNPVREGSKEIRKLISDLFELDESCNSYMDAFDPSFSSKEGSSKLAIWFDENDRNTGEIKRKRGKPGRMFKRMFPLASEKEVAKFAEAYSERFTQEPITLHVSEKAEDFKFAYSSKLFDSKVTPITCDLRKCLYASCMQRTNNDLDICSSLPHFAEAYASGDFKIVWCNDENLDLHSRCVIFKKGNDMKDWEAGPIYGVSEASIDKIKNWLVLNEINHDKDFQWLGARFVPIAYDDKYIMPFVDFSTEYLSLTKNEGFLTIVEEKEGEFTAGNQCAISQKIKFCTLCKTNRAIDGYTINDESHCYRCFIENTKVCCISCMRFTVDLLERVRFSDDDECTYIHKNKLTTHAEMFEGEYWFKSSLMTLDCGKKLPKERIRILKKQEQINVEPFFYFYG